MGKKLVKPVRFERKQLYQDFFGSSSPSFLESGMNKEKEIKKIEYQVLSRKYRPKYFSELIGQETL